MDTDQMKHYESLCIQQEPPRCVTICPLHIDVKLMLQQVAAGQFQEAFKTYRKSAAFPQILCHICDAPCERACRLSEIGDGIRIRDIEAWLTETNEPPQKLQMMPDKRKSAAIIGSGLDALMAAYELQRKGYHITLFECSGSFGGKLRLLSESQLPHEAINQSITILKGLGIQLISEELPALSELCTQNANGTFSILNQEYLCLYLSEHSEAIDAISRMTATDGVFAGDAEEGAWANLASDGRRAAVSMDRYMQRVSLTAARPVEGSFESKLFTSLEDVSATKSQLTSDASITEEQAKAEAARCIQCECMECFKACKFFQNYNSYPRGLIRQLYNTVHIVSGLRLANKMINSCAECGQCEALCPNGFKFQDAIDDTRQIMVQTDKMPPSAFDFALRDMAFSNSDAFALARNPQGVEAAKYVFFPGCQLSASNAAGIEFLYDRLNEIISDPVGIILRCCGSIALWAGNRARFQEAHDELVKTIHEMGDPEIITACPSCLKTFKEHYPEVKVRSIWPLLDQHTQATTSDFKATLAIHDPCAARYEKADQDAIRSIATKFGVKLQELKLNREKTACCSYGGNAWNSNPSLSHDMIDARIAEDPHNYFTYCAMCQSFFQGRGKLSYHILDLLLDPQRVITGEAQPNIDYSMRHENRSRVKRHIMQKYWGDKMAETPSWESIKLIIPDSVRKLMNERLILVEDLQRVIEAAEKSGRHMKNAETGHYLVYGAPVCVTYWVEYLPKGDSYEVFAAYSHRMSIREVRV